MIIVGRPWCFHTLSKYNFASPLLLRMSVVRMIYICLVNLSMTVSMVLYSCTIGGPVIMSTEISIHGTEGMLFGWSFSTEGYQSAFIY